MILIRVRYKGPTEKKGSRLIADAPHWGRYTRGLNSIENELSELGKPNEFGHCCQHIAREYIDKKWPGLESKDAMLLHGWHSKNEDFFMVVHGKQLDNLLGCDEEEER